ncbi:MAG: FtsQ-type POTRA domain-containing protein [Cryobacterium sp.]
MKRPAGFEHRPAPRPPAAPGRPERPAARTPASGHRAPSNPDACSSAVTEPIGILQPEPATLAPISPLRPSEQASNLPTEAGLTPGDLGNSDDRTTETPALTPAAARKKLRGAKRARKQYEREEVRRFTWRSRRRRTTWLVSIGTLLALVGFVLAGAYSPLMALRTIEVVGAKRVSAEQVRAALGGQLGTPLPLIDFTAVRSDLSRFRLIRSYVVESRPPGTIVVRIVEREPIGVIPAGGGFILVDAAGVVIESGDEPIKGYPAISAQVGTSGFAAASAVVSSLPVGIRTQLRTVNAATKDDVTLTLKGGARVVWGSAEKSDYKAVVLGALMVGHPVDDVREYDVSSPDSAVIR